MTYHKPHIEKAHATWKSFLRPGDTVVDATCGNGHDTLFLAHLGELNIIAIDIQARALAAAQERLGPLASQVAWRLECHSQLPQILNSASPRLIVYNLGYLPGGDKSKTTLMQTTLQSLHHAVAWLLPGGLISITCYPGHPEGEREEIALLEWAVSLNPLHWQVDHRSWSPREAKRPSLLLLSKLQ